MVKHTEPLSRTELRRKMSEFETNCRRSGLRVTPQRMAVYEALIEADDHPSAEMVYRKVRRRFPTISLDTVNRSLSTFSRIGAATVVEGTGGAKRFDGDLSKHQHFRCVKCGRIIDFLHEPFEHMEVPDTLKSQFRIVRSTVYFEGVCDRCKPWGNESI